MLHHRLNLFDVLQSISMYGEIGWSDKTKLPAASCNVAQLSEYCYTQQGAVVMNCGYSAAVAIVCVHHPRLSL